MTPKLSRALLRNAGYRTGFVGKIGVEFEPGAVEEMFDYYETLDRNPYFRGERHISQIAGDKAIEFLRSQDGDEPFSLSISFNAPHAEDDDKEDHYPWPRVMDGMYDDVTVAAPHLSEPSVFESQPEFLKSSLNRERWYWRWDTPEKYQKNMKGYYRMVSGVDHVMGRVLDEVDRLGLAENTVVVFSSDNGYYLGSRGFAGKWSHYEESLRVPLVIYDPRSEKRGQTEQAMVLNVDIPATILDIAGIEAPGTYQGVSLVPFVQDETPLSWRTDFFVEHHMHYPGRIPKWKGLRDERYVYARYFEQSPPFEFFHDLETDPMQLANLVDDPEYRTALDRARRRTDVLRDDYGGPFAVYEEPEPRTPNVVLIISDDQAWTDFGFMGHSVIETPHIDELAREGATFTRGYVPTALCRASLATLATGLYAHQHGLTGNDPTIPLEMQGPTYWNDPRYRELNTELIANIDRVPTLPRLLAERGYVSFQSGKWWEGSYARGGFTDGMTHGDPDRGGRHGDDGLAIGREGLQPIFDFIETAGDNPFFVWYAPFLPHFPHTPPDRLLEKYEAPGRPIELARYFAMCEWLDETVGDLMTYLEENELDDDTLVVFIADNGWIQKNPETATPPDWPTSFAPKSKQSPYEGGTRTPIILRWPTVIEPARYETLASSIDIVPTILHATGSEVPANLPGVNLMNAVEGRTIPRAAIFGEGFAHDIADIHDPTKSLLYRWCIQGPWKLILTYDGATHRYGTIHPRTDGSPQLYDLITDPHETTNVATQHREIVAWLSERIARWWHVP